MKKQEFWLLISLLVVISLLAVACGSGDDEATDASEPADVSQEEATEAPAEEAAEEPAEVMEESSITIIIPEDPAGFNAYAADTGYSQMLMELVMMGLTDLDAEGNIFPELAAELPTIENGGVVFDEENWTMDVTWKLRDDVFWSDGEPVTVDDVIFTWDAIGDPELGTWSDGIDYTDSIEKVDDHTMIVHYNSVFPNYLLQFGSEDFGVWPAHYCDASQGFLSWDCNREPLSNGPYLLEEWETGDHITFVRNPDYHEEGKPGIDKIFVRIVPESSVAQQLMLEGDADVQIWPTESDAEAYKNADNVEVSFAPSERWVMRLVPNLAAKGEIDSEAYPHPILSDVNVRQALRMAIDVDTITEDIFLGYSKPQWTEMFRPPYACEIPRPAYDPEGAAALLEEAGWIDEDGDGIRECHGCATGAEEGYPMSMEFMIYAEYGEELELAQQLIAENWRDVGIDTELSMVEGTTMWSGFEDGGLEQTGNYDINMWDDGYPGIDPTDWELWNFYYSEAAEPDYGWNVQRWYNEDFDALLDEAYTLDEEYRKELFCDIAQILDEELPQIMLFTAFDASGHSARLQGLQATVNDTHTWNVADWTVSE
ncbi:MAG TPA: peptide ABC transporter substrate-binding protein [Anaerolineae bacterium]|jgi:peptide/nickel transport system substrate-binding protein|nr:peptide ABC transporter substrate-binding protein [Anaerolineae bacterium]